MKTLESLNELKTILNSNRNIWLLLYKAGSSQSDCAAENLKSVIINKAEKDIVFIADVNKCTDIHPAFNIQTVPALLHFENGKLKNSYKGCHTADQYYAIINQLTTNLSQNNQNNRSKRVIVYTTPTCTWCNTIKRHFKEHGIQYQEIDISVDQKAAEEMVRRSGRQGVPQTDINGEIIVGFDKTRLNRLLEIN